MKLIYFIVLLDQFFGCSGRFFVVFKDTFCYKTSESHFYHTTINDGTDCSELCLNTEGCIAANNNTLSCYLINDCNWNSLQDLSYQLNYLCSVSAFNAVADVHDVDEILTDGRSDTCVSLSEHQHTWGFTTDCPSKVNATLVMTYRNKCDTKVEVFIVERENLCPLKVPRPCTRTGEDTIQEHSGGPYCTMSFVCISEEALNMDRLIINKPYLTLCEVQIK